MSDNGVNNKLNIEVMNIEKEQVATLNANVNAANAASVELTSESTFALLKNVYPNIFTDEDIAERKIH